MNQDQEAAYTAVNSAIASKNVSYQLPSGCR